MAKQQNPSEESERPPAAASLPEAETPQPDEPVGDGGAAPAAADLLAALAATEARAAQIEDKYLRALADLDNYRRRVRSEMDDARRFASEMLVRDLLAVLDSLQLALASLTADDAAREGFAAIERQLRDVLERHGLAAIEAVGEPFDPHRHEAVATVEPEDGQTPGAVVEELRRGYTLHDRVLRPTMVKVAQT